MESRKAKLKRIFTTLYQLKVGDFVSLKFDIWDYYKVVNEYEVIKLKHWKHENIEAGYNCKDLVDLTCTMLNDFNDNILEDVSLKMKTEGDEPK